MGRLRIFSGQEICRFLERHGFLEVRQHGSHIIMQRRVQRTTQTVPVPNHKEVKFGTLLSIIRQSGVSRTEFEE